MTFLDFIKALLFGCVQGLSEFLPISSSGHLVLLEVFLPVPSFDLFFILVLHLGTLAAILSYYRKDLLENFSRSLVHPIRKEKSDWVGRGRLMALLFVATLPSIGGAFFLAPLVEKSLRQPYWTGLGFILTALCLFFTRWRLQKEKNISHSGNLKNWSSFSFFTAFLVGLAQLAAFFPGMSRSGWTISTALFLGRSQKQAVFFSFLMAIPAIVGGVLFELFNRAMQENFSISSLCLAFFSSWFFGYLALKWLIHSLQNRSFPLFAFYLWPLGIFLIFCTFFNYI